MKEIHQKQSMKAIIQASLRLSTCHSRWTRQLNQEKEASHQSIFLYLTFQNYLKTALNKKDRNHNLSLNNRVPTNKWRNRHLVRPIFTIQSSTQAKHKPLLLRLDKLWLKYHWRTRSNRREISMLMQVIFRLGCGKIRCLRRTNTIEQA